MKIRSFSVGAFHLRSVTVDKRFVLLVFPLQSFDLEIQVGDFNLLIVILLSHFLQFGLQRFYLVIIL